MKFFISELLEINFLLMECFLAYLWTKLKGTVIINIISLPFCFFLPIGKLSDLSQWVKVNMQFIPRLGLIILSGTVSNHGIKFIM